MLRSVVSRVLKLLRTEVLRLVVLLGAEVLQTVIGLRDCSSRGRGVWIQEVSRFKAVDCPHTSERRTAPLNHRTADTTFESRNSVFVEGFFAGQVFVCTVAFQCGLRDFSKDTFFDEPLTGFFADVLQRTLICDTTGNISRQFSATFTGYSVSKFSCGGEAFQRDCGSGCLHCSTNVVNTLLILFLTDTTVSLDCNRNKRANRITNHATSSNTSGAKRKP